MRALILEGLAEHWGSVDEALNPDLDDIDASYGHGRTLVIRRSGSIVATGTLVRRDATTAEIVRMSVASHVRRSGLGRRIVDELLATAREWGVAIVVLETSAHWSDVVDFYLSCGFTVTHQSSGPFGQDTWFRREV